MVFEMQLAKISMIIHVSILSVWTTSALDCT
jgi:hypothetical protein